MLRQIEWWLQNGPITKDGVLPVTTLFFWKFCFSLRTSYKYSWFNVPTAQMSIFVLFVSAGVLYDSAFSLWATLNWSVYIIVNGMLLNKSNYWINIGTLYFVITAPLCYEIICKQ